MQQKKSRSAGRPRYFLRLLLVVLLLGALPTIVNASEKKPVIPRTDFAGRVGKPVAVKVVMPSIPLLGGNFYSVVADPLSYPAHQPPDILPGLPTTRVVCHRAGTYRVRFRINQISKGSCASASADTLLDQVVTLHITR